MTSLEEISRPDSEGAKSKEFIFAGDLKSMAEARESVMGFIRPYCSSEVEEVDLFLVLQEVLSNAVLHGCANDKAKKVHCSVEIDPSAFTIVVRDPGAGFDPEAVTQSVEARGEVSEHGRGILIMRSLMDEVSYHCGGSEVRMRKLRAVRRWAAV